MPPRHPFCVLGGSRIVPSVGDDPGGSALGLPEAGLLAALALRAGETVDTETLIVAGWGEAAAGRDAPGRLRTALWRLRRTFDDLGVGATIDRDEIGYVFRPAPVAGRTSAVDALDLLAAVGPLRQLAADDPEAAVERWQEEWPDGWLTVLPDVVPGLWLAADRFPELGTIHAVVVEAAVLRGHALLESGRVHEAAAAARRLAAVTGGHPDASALLAAALAATGRRLGALRAIETARRAGPDTLALARLEQEVLAGTIVPAMAMAARPAASPWAPLGLAEWSDGGAPVGEARDGGAPDDRVPVGGAPDGGGSGAGGPGAGGSGDGGSASVLLLLARPGAGASRRWRQHLPAAVDLGPIVGAHAGEPLGLADHVLLATELAHAVAGGAMVVLDDATQLGPPVWAAALDAIRSGLDGGGRALVVLEADHPETDRRVTEAIHHLGPYRVGTARLDPGRDDRAVAMAADAVAAAARHLPLDARVALAAWCGGFPAPASMIAARLDPDDERPVLDQAEAQVDHDPPDELAVWWRRLIGSLAADAAAVAPLVRDGVGLAPDRLRERSAMPLGRALDLLERGQAAGVLRPDVEAGSFQPAFPLARALLRRP